MERVSGGADVAAVDNRRSNIISEARRHFMADGYAATRIEPIARAASVSTATLYGWFPSKTVLFSAVVEDAAADFANLMDGVQCDEGDARAQLTRFARAYAHFMGDPFVRSVFRLVMAERPRFRETAMSFFERGRTDFGGPLIASLRTLTQRGELKIDKPSWAAGQMMGMIENPVFFVPLVTGDEMQTVRTPDAIADDAVETFMARYGV